AEAIARKFGIEVATDDYRRVIEQIDAVVIATPPVLHARMALDAIAAGVHVFCEKPLAASLGEGRQIRDAAAAAGVTGMMNFQQRFTPHFRRSAEMVAEGAVGRLLMADMRVPMNPVAYMHYPIWSSSKAGWFADAGQGGGLLASSVGPHLADLLLWHGGPIAEVACRTIVSRTSISLPDGSQMADISGEDGFVLLGRYASGALLTIRGVPVAHGAGEWTLELDGDAGSLVVDGTRVLYYGEHANDPTEVALPTDMPDLRVGIASRFIKAVRAGDPTPTPSLSDGVAAQAVLDAALEAARTDRWVKVEQP
ncbi:MAG: Gfo/Idh/MocA family protein, partial [Vicinamibacterales bacterium]